jgi:hypothetical protein
MPGHQDDSERISYRVSAINTVTPGGSYIQNIRFLYPWNTSTVVTVIPAGERFDFIVDYRAVNLSGNLVDPWSMCIVFWDDTNIIKGWYFRNQALSGAPTIIDDNNARIANAFQLFMPNHNLTLHFNMFANDDNTPAVQHPDESAWALTR